MHTHKVSVIIPVYNGGAALDRCLGSVCGQTYEGIEVVVVDDASTDRSGGLARAWAGRDGRVRVVRHKRNEGRHVARITGTDAATGDYALFLDADDELCDDTVVARLVGEMVREPVDVLRFGLEAVAVEGTPEDEARQLAAWSSVGMGRMEGREALRHAFLAECENELPWHITHRLYRAPLLKQAFARMVTARLERAEDAYEYLVVASLAASERDACDIVGYRYHLGSGSMNARDLRAKEFLTQASALRDSYEAALAYASTLGDALVDACATDFKRKLLETVGNLWHERVALADKPETARELAGIVGPDETCCELFRLVRDRAYDFVATRTVPAASDELFALLGIANVVRAGAGGTGPEHGRAESMRAVAEGHVGELLAPAGRLAALEAELDGERRRSALLEERLSAVEGSVSFRCGRALTAPLRTLRSIVPGAGTGR